MTCVLGMVVEREREIRDFVKTPYYKIIGKFGKDDKHLRRKELHLTVVEHYLKKIEV